MRAMPKHLQHFLINRGARPRARVRDRLTIPGNLAQDEPGAKFGRSPRRTLQDLPISIFSFSETIAVQNFVPTPNPERIVKCPKPQALR